MLRKLTGQLYAALAPNIDPFAPHDGVSMEGYFVHVFSATATGSPCTLLVIFCLVKTAADPTRRVKVFVAYMPGHHPPGSALAQAEAPGGFIREMFAPGWTLTHDKSGRAVGAAEEFQIEVDGYGTFQVGKDTQKWTVHMPGDGEGETIDLELVASNRTPWTKKLGIGGPRRPGSFERLGTLIPLHWHIFSLASHAEWTLTRSTSGSPPTITRGTGVAHIEKNHGVGFPSGWIWTHSLAPSPSVSSASAKSGDYAVKFALAGGLTAGTEAYIAGFRDDARGIEWDIGPPLAMGGRGRGLGLRTTRSWAKKTVSIDLWDWGRWLHAEVVAPPDTNIQIAGPMETGFTPGLCHHSYQAKTVLTLRERPFAFSWTQPWSVLNPAQWAWRTVGEYVLEESTLEFGGDFASDTGKRDRAD